VQYAIDIGGRLRRVSIVPAGDGFAVSVDDRSYHVAVARMSAHTLSLVVDSGVAPGPQVSHQVTLAPPVAGQVLATVDGIPLTLTVEGRGRWRPSRDGGAEGRRAVRAPMPGRVVRVLVKPGDTVAARQPLVVVEAMKMENELRATAPGTIAEVHAREGMPVDAGAVLVVVQ
jgi:biotin carboxyl carrier protein